MNNPDFGERAYVIWEKGTNRQAFKHGRVDKYRWIDIGSSFLPSEFTAGRYHSLFAVREKLPAVLAVTAASDDGVIMAIEHASLPLAAVQFHPESILTLGEDLGLRLIRNVVAYLGR